MSTLSDLRHYFKQYIENEEARSVLAFTTYYQIQQYKSEENYSERIDVIKESDNNLLIFDNKFGKYYLAENGGQKIWTDNNRITLEEKMTGDS